MDPIRDAAEIAAYDAKIRAVIEATKRAQAESIRRWIWLRPVIRVTHPDGVIEEIRC